MAEQPQYTGPEQSSTPFENGDVLEFHVATSEHLQPYDELKEARQATQQALGVVAAYERSTPVVEQLSEVQRIARIGDIMNTWRTEELGNREAA